VTSFNAYQQYIVQRDSKYITSQNANFILLLTAIAKKDIIENMM